MTLFWHRISDVTFFKKNVLLIFFINGGDIVLYFMHKKIYKKNPQKKRPWHQIHNNFIASNKNVKLSNVLGLARYRIFYLFPPLTGTAEMGTVFKILATKKSKFLPKMKIFAKNENFRQKWKFSPRMKIFAKNENFSQKSKIWSKIKILVNNEYFIKNRNFGQK